MASRDAAAGRELPAWCCAVGLGATLAVLFPAFYPGASDSFPLSTYPMFSRQRGNLVLSSVVGREPDGTARTLPPELVASGEVLQTKVLIEAAGRGGARALARLCSEVATRAAGGAASGLASVEVVRRQYDPVRYFEGAAEPLAEHVLARCPLPVARDGVAPR
jgi:hypothetical protein